jgi:hypothetical protein
VIPDHQLIPVTAVRVVVRIAIAVIIVAAVSIKASTKATTLETTVAETATVYREPAASETAVAHGAPSPSFAEPTPLQKDGQLSATRRFPPPWILGELRVFTSGS